MQEQETKNQELIDVVSNFDLMCCNGMMLLGLLYEHEKFGTTYVVEDGMIVAKICKNKIIRGDKNEIRKSRRNFM